MVRKLSISVFIIIFASQVFAQTPGLTLKVSTDKPEYVYGEPIEVTVTIFNKSDSSISIWGSTTCIVHIGMNAIPFQFDCTADYREYKFLPGAAQAWIWQLEPSKLGLPDQDSIQVIHGYGGGMGDAVIVHAPKYYGGRLGVGVKFGITEEEMKALRDSLNVVLLSRYSLGSQGSIEYWQIIDKTVDSLAVVLRDDYRLRWVKVERTLFFKNHIVTTIPSQGSPLTSFSLSQNYPNPFNPSTVIEFTLPEQQFVTLKIYDLLGNEIETLVNEQLSSGMFRVNWTANYHAAGMYFYRLKAGEFVETKKLILLK